ncbi:MAG: P-loop NTPase fold protein [Bryobacteraceae bacterium]
MTLPQVKRNHDDLGRWKFATQIVELIKMTPLDWSVRIGILGRWGEGKSSVLAFIATQLSEHGDVVIPFNPWAVGNWNDLWLEFTVQLLRSLKEAGIKIEGALPKQIPKDVAHQLGS